MQPLGLRGWTIRGVTGIVHSTTPMDKTGRQARAYDRPLDSPGKYRPMGPVDLHEIPAIIYGIAPRHSCITS